MLFPLFFIICFFLFIILTMSLYSLSNISQLIQGKSEAIVIVNHKSFGRSEDIIAVSIKIRFQGVMI